MRLSAMLAINALICTVALFVHLCVVNLPAAAAHSPVPAAGVLEPEFDHPDSDADLPIAKQARFSEALAGETGIDPDTALANEASCINHAKMDPGNAQNVKAMIRKCVGTYTGQKNRWFGQLFNLKHRRLVVFPDTGDWAKIVQSRVVSIDDETPYRTNQAARTALQNDYPAEGVNTVAGNLPQNRKHVTIHEALCCHDQNADEYKCIVQAVASIINRAVSHYGGSWQVSKHQNSGAAVMPTCNGANTVARIMALYDAVRCDVMSADPNTNRPHFNNAMGCPIVDDANPGDGDDDAGQEDDV